MGAKKYAAVQLQQNIWIIAATMNSNTDNTVTIHITNQNTMPVFVSIAMLDTPTLPPQQQDSFIFNHEIPPLSYEFWRGIAVPAGESIAILTNETNTTALIYGFEEDNN